MSERKRKPRMRRSRGVLVSLCLVAAIVLAVGTGVTSLHTQATSDAFSASSPATNLPESAVEAGWSGNDKDQPTEIAHDEVYGDYEKDTLLVPVEESTDLAQLSASLAANEFVLTESVADQDISAGFVQVELAQDTPLDQALDTLDNQGIEAQPNYIYYPLDDAVTSVESAGSTDQSETAIENDDRSGEQPSSANEQEAVDAAVGTSASATNDLDTITQLFNGAETVDAAAENASVSESEDSVDTMQSTANAVSVNDPEASKQWMLQSMNVYSAWNIAKSKDDNADAPSVSVAVVDTGCLYTHEDLNSNILAAYNSDTEQVGINQIADSNGHGTHVAGIVAADANNGKGVAGSSYDAGLVIIKASEGETKNFSTITLAQAYTWLLSNSESSASSPTIAQKYGVRVVNMSVGGEGTVKPDLVMYKNITKAKNAGILTVCAAGNSEGNSVPPFNCIPGDYEDCFTVINLLKQDSGTPNDSSGTMYVKRSDGSNYNVADGALSTAKNISAPGTSIYSTENGSTSSYGYKTGTSMASPAVAGVAALLFAYDPSLSASEVREILEQTATDIGAEGWDRETGYGEVDAYHALQVLSAEIKNDEVTEGASIDLRDASGQPMDLSEWNWTSSKPALLAVDANSGALTVKGSGYATLKATHKRLANRTIEKKVSVGSAAPIIDLSQVEVSKVADQSYTGQAITPTPVVHAQDGRLLVLGQDYALQYENNVDVGFGKITVSPIADEGSTGAKSVSFKIIPVQFSRSSTTISGVRDLPYNGRAQTQSSVQVVFNGKTLRNGSDYTIEYRTLNDAAVQPQAVGDYKLVVVGKGSYTGSVSSTFRIYSTSSDSESSSSGNSGNTGGSSGNSGSSGDSGNTGNTGNTGSSGSNSGTSSGGNTGNSGSTINPGNTGSSTNPGNTGNTSTTAAPAQSPDKAPSVSGTWKKSHGKWWYSYNANTKAAQGGKSWPSNGWVVISGKRYHFDGSGYMHTNWFKQDGSWYWLGSDGAMKTGWQKVKRTWYFMGSDGKMLTGKQVIAGQTYYLNSSSGAMKTGWNSESDGWHYYTSSGAMKTGWQKVKGKWYYLDPARSGLMKTGFYDVGGVRYLSNGSGAMITGWARVDGSWYYFSGSGALQKNRWIGNYYVGSDGVMATNTWIGSYHVNVSGKWDATRR